MKKGINIAGLIIALLLSVNVFAGDSIVEVVNEKTFRLSVDDMSSDFRISLFDESSRRIYHQNVKGQEDFSMHFNLKRLPFGTYTLEVEDSEHMQEYKVNLTGNGVEVKEVRNILSYSPGIFVKDQHLFVNALSIGKSSEVSVNVTDARNKVVFTDTFSGTESFGKIYDTSSLPEGKYNVAVTTNGHVREKAFKKN